MSMCEYLNKRGDFYLKDAGSTSGLYFPLANEAGYMASITPRGGGDAKIDQNHFLMPPVSVVDLHNTRLTRTAWLKIENGQVWSVTGGSHEQKTHNAETQGVKAGPLWHTILRENAEAQLSAEMTTFVPIDDVHAEVTRLLVRNAGEQPVRVVPTVVIPMYGRSADSLRDHRHVTSLLNVTEVGTNGVYLTPTMSFDERGHVRNTTVYAVLGADSRPSTPVGCYPDLDVFIGEGGDAERPRVIYDDEYAGKNLLQSGAVVHGSEAVGALQFAPAEIPPGGTHEIYIVAGIFPDQSTASAALNAYGGAEKFETALQNNRTFWHGKLNTVACTTADPDFDSWMRWVSLQPILRRIYGCSFLPHHDYGRGGRGWRDLWQDCLALLLMEPESVRETLLQNLAGVRFDGTNATIIGTRPGEFIADRNNISRVWMDHGAWPLLTIQLYIDQTGDLSFLFESQEYFSDPQWARAQQKIQQDHSDSTTLYNQNGEVVFGSVLEHLLLQQLSAFFHVGSHNSIRLEGGDWNDGLDMAAEGGESVAFTGLYASNLQWLADAVLKVAKSTQRPIVVAQELLMLLDHYTASDIDYSNPKAKNDVLQRFFSACKNGPSGVFINLNHEKLAADLKQKSESIIAHVRGHGESDASKGYGWFNGYYDNSGRRDRGRF
ncbi:MAG: cellobiose phosphorylase [Spirochaetia bacterium]|nr:cellobiose phosphorylase [Spirochaetia bacterium]